MPTMGACDGSDDKYTPGKMSRGVKMQYGPKGDSPASTYQMYHQGGIKVGPLQAGQKVTGIDWSQMMRKRNNHAALLGVDELQYLSL